MWRIPGVLVEVDSNVLDARHGLRVWLEVLRADCSLSELEVLRADCSLSELAVLRADCSLSELAVVLR